MVCYVSTQLLLTANRCYRRDVLQALNADLKAELQYASKVGRGNPKNYQVWYVLEFARTWLINLKGTIVK